MQANEITDRRSVATKQGMVTRRIYQKESQLIEKIWSIYRPRSLGTLRAALDLLWDYYQPRVGSQRRRPELRFGPGVQYHGKAMSYTQDQRPGQIIELAPGERNFGVLIHELAHALGAVEHGVRFAQIYHDLLKHRTFREMMSTPEGLRFLEYLKLEHPRFVRRAYRG